MADTWLSKAPCRGLPTEWFFSSSSAASKRSTALCKPCPYKESCLALGVATAKKYGNSHLVGKWGGQSEWQYKKERKRLKSESVSG